MNFVRNLITFVAIVVALYALWWAWAGLSGSAPVTFFGSGGSASVGGGGDGVGSGVRDSVRGFGKSLGCSWGGNC